MELNILFSYYLLNSMDRVIDYLILDLMNKI